ncbi:hypothetical protein XH80_04020 [Bradyrhizobium sp. CCBAU 45384]|nr:hypothetical protein [Bradyrhizobium sp. CCBAU 45384]
MISVQAYLEQLLAAYRKRLARIEREGEPADRYSVEERAVEIQRIRATIALLEQDLHDAK